jgi:hypothetical protein
MPLSALRWLRITGIGVGLLLLPIVARAQEETKKEDPPKPNASEPNARQRLRSTLPP